MDVRTPTEGFAVLSVKTETDTSNCKQSVDIAPFHQSSAAKKPGLMDLPNELLYKIVHELVLDLDIDRKDYCWPVHGTKKGGMTIHIAPSSASANPDNRRIITRHIYSLGANVRSITLGGNGKGSNQGAAHRAGFGDIVPIGYDNGWKAAWEHLALARVNKFMKKAVWNDFDAVLQAQDQAHRANEIREAATRGEVPQFYHLPALKWKTLLRSMVLHNRVTYKELCETVWRSLKARGPDTFAAHILRSYHSAHYP